MKARADRSAIASAAIAVGLVLCTLVLYAPARHFDYVDLDDNEYVFDNPAVTSGWSAANVRWALTAFHSGHWHPLTWLSLMTDSQLFGTDAGASHAVNGVLHALAVALLFLALKEASGRTGASALAAALFGLHPLRVESVAWVAARKDVLSGLLLMVTLWCHARYARRESAGRYAMTVFSFALALLAKPTVAVVPCALLLLDYWPLCRLRWSPAAGVSPAQPPRVRRSALWLVVEKLPMLALAALTLAQTWAAQKAAGAVMTGAALTLPVRIANALWNYVLYLERTFWPFDLAPFYPLAPVPVARAAAAAALLAAVSIVVVRARARRPWRLVGWLWFVGTLVPESGIVQFGGQSVADRYSYIPHIGLFLGLAWEATERTAAWSRGLRVAGAGAALAALAVVSSSQLAYWKDSITLFEHALAVTSDNYFIHNNLGVALEQAGRRDEAARHYMEAARLNPTWPEALNNAGIAYAWEGRLPEAVANFTEALRIRPNFARAENNLGTALSSLGNLDGALVHYRRAVELQPDYLDALAGLGGVCERLGRLVEAEKTYARLVELTPSSQTNRHRLERVRAAIAAWNARTQSTR